VSASSGHQAPVAWAVLDECDNRHGVYPDRESAEFRLGWVKPMSASNTFRVEALYSASSVAGMVRDSERIQWLEDHDYSPSCYNVPTRGSDRWSAPMKPNNGWIIAIDPAEQGAPDVDCHGKTLRDCIDWTRKCLAKKRRETEEASE
jgi:hypothetical protein